MKLSGWGNNIKVNSNILYPRNNNEIIKILQEKKINNILCRGLGRSYGDNNLNSNIIFLTKYKKKIKIDKKKNFLICTANISISEIYELLIKNGFYLNVTPGSKNVTIGGAIANDVHGKNHHIDGSFSKYVSEIQIITPKGKLKSCSLKKNKELFKATCGGAGLTGLIVSAKIKLFKINSKNIDVTLSSASTISETISKLRRLKKSKYLIAWVDTINKNNFGRSIIISGNHSNDKNLNLKKKITIKLPSIIGKIFLNKFFMGIFNNFYYYLNKRKSTFVQEINDFFYPLDVISNWNQFYGKNGFTQIQILIPEKKNLIEIANKIFHFLNTNKVYSYLTTMKEFGDYNQNYLSFPAKGLTITLDIPVTKKLNYVYPKLEKIFIKHNIRVYWAKDSYMSKKHFNRSYKKINIFKKIKNKIDSQNKLSSIQSRRLGI